MQIQISLQVVAIQQAGRFSCVYQLEKHLNLNQKYPLKSHMSISKGIILRNNICCQLAIFATAFLVALLSVFFFMKTLLLNSSGVINVGIILWRALTATFSSFF